MSEGQYVYHQYIIKGVAATAPRGEETGKIGGEGGGVRHKPKNHTHSKYQY